MAKELDQWVAKLEECKQLEESQVKTLCEKVGVLLIRLGCIRELLSLYKTCFSRRFKETRLTEKLSCQTSNLWYICQLATNLQEVRSLFLETSSITAVSLLTILLGALVILWWNKAIGILFITHWWETGLDKVGINRRSYTHSIYSTPLMGMGCGELWWVRLALFPGLPRFCSSVCVLCNTQKWKSGENGEGLGTPITWIMSGGRRGEGSTFK